MSGGTCRRLRRCATHTQPRSARTPRAQWFTLAAPARLQPSSTAGLAAHDARIASEAAEKAWDACVTSMRYEDGSPLDIVANVNPYRAEADRIAAERNAS